MSTATAAQTRTWQIDPAHTQATFEVKHMMFAKVRGSFESVAGEFTLGERDELDGWSVEAEIDATSINTGQSQRDDHLRSPDFFDVDSHSTIGFKSNTVRAGEDGAIVVEGELTIRGVTRPVALLVDETGRGIDPWGNERIAFSATTTIDRRDFDLTWNQALETGGVLVGHDVAISLEVQATPQA